YLAAVTIECSRLSLHDALPSLTQQVVQPDQQQERDDEVEQREPRAAAQRAARSPILAPAPLPAPAPLRLTPSRFPLHRPGEGQGPRHLAHSSSAHRAEGLPHASALLFAPPQFPVV